MAIVETRRLQAFIKIVDTGSLTRAADLLGVAQPALSQQVVAMEAEFGAPLLERSRRGVTPTRAGRALYRHAQVILRQLAQAQAEIKDVSAELTGVVSLGMPLSSAMIVVGPLLEVVRKRHPGVQVHVFDGFNGAALRDLTINGQLDIALLPGERPIRGMSMTPLFTEELVFVAARGIGEKLKPGPISISELQEFPLLLPSKHTYLRELIDAAFDASACTQTVVAEMDTAYSLCGGAARDLGSTILPAASARHAGGALQIRRIAPKPIGRMMSIATFDATPLSAPAAAVLDLMVEVIRDEIGSGAWDGARLPEGLDHKQRL